MDKKTTLTIALSVIAIGGAYFAFKAITKPAKKNLTSTTLAGPKKCKTQADCPRGTTCVGDNPRVCVGSTLGSYSF